MKLISKNTSKFEKTEIDESKVLNYLINIEKKFLVFLKFWKKRMKLVVKLKTSFTVDSKPGILYSLSKIHKAVTGNMPSFHPVRH